MHVPLEQGASSSVLPLLNTASQVGFGAVIASLIGFALIRDAVLDIAPGNPLVSLSIAVNILAGITGSASGGMTIALQTLGDTWLAMGQAAGIAPDLLHRVTARLPPAGSTHCRTTGPSSRCWAFAGSRIASHTSTFLSSPSSFRCWRCCWWCCWGRPSARSERPQADD